MRRIIPKHKFFVADDMIFHNNQDQIRFFLVDLN